ncbi:hypothetical protein GC163_08575 [bacterium]|nr:hypothetical protein [bacterium]
MTAAPRIVIVKVGGSLYDLHDLGARLTTVCRQLNAAVPVLFPGGGPTADLVRGWHEQFELTEDVSHHLAISALRLNSQLLAKLLPRAHVVTDFAMLQELSRTDRIPVLDPGPRLEDLEQRLTDEAPPHHWDVTSDSLAAWTTIHWPATELLLLKSAPCPVGTVTAAAQAGVVDPYFPGLAGRIPRITWCCLRDESPVITPWLDHGAPQEP